MKKTAFIFVLIATLFFPPLSAFAGECCGCDPIYDRDWHGEVIISAYVRNEPCMVGTAILKTVVKGSIIQIVGETDGWYKVRLAEGTVGWVGASLMRVADKPLTDTSGAETGSAAPNFSKYLGYIFLAVQKNGEAYYYYPVDKKGYYLGRPADAFNIMRNLGLGATHDFIHNTAYYPNHVIGRILLDVESHGEAYYIYPKDRKKYYLGRPDDAFSIMRGLGLGVSNADLAYLPIASQ